MPKGYLALVLHAHLPYVRHPEYEYFLEENWYFEALTETYLPLLDVFDRLTADGVPFRITVGLTPPLLSMFGDRFLAERYLRHLDSLLELADREVDRTRWEPWFRRLAEMYRGWLQRARHLFAEVYQGDPVQGFLRLQEAGRLELITSAATHGYLPLLDYNPPAVQAQIRIGVAEHRRRLGRQ
ncbi:MAG TPA: DUF1957 domain-containing protein, partial [Firmicutes bacterium]|nr:DUF1957 domain-containing protein [Bacillota bacterium]